MLFPMLLLWTDTQIFRYERTARKPVITSGKLAEGIKLMLIGFAEKLFLFGSYVRDVAAYKGVSTDSLSAACAWLGIIAFSFAFLL